MSDLVFHNIRKTFPGDVVAVEDFSLTIPDPSMVILVGPSGCGKTTLLRMIAGLETPTSGEIRLGETRLDVLPPQKRDVAMVFQNYALYPHMTVAENLSFGLRLRKTPKTEITASVDRVARTLDVHELLSRKPGELSGGQRQRVALGRAIIREPRVFLFDEPLSNLDARLRDEMRATIKRLYQDLATTSIYVTHDQVEAMTIGEMLVVMNKGRVHQVGSPEHCYHEPADLFVASFLGSPPMNFLRGKLDPASPGRLRLDNAGEVTLPDALAARLIDQSEIVLGVRPEDVLAAESGDAVELSSRAKVVLRESMGHETLTHMQLGESQLIARGARRFEEDADGRAKLYIRTDNLKLFTESGERI